MTGTDQAVAGRAGAEGPGHRPVGRHLVAVVGAGPSGLYAAGELLRSSGAVLVDVFDRLPTPFGLIRYGVAPDHPKIKSVDRVLARPFATPNVRFIGNVEIGADVSHDDLLRHYDAVIYATGSQADRAWDLKDTAGCPVVGSARFVSWYSGHPDTAGVDFTLECHTVAVVGGGNVALDVARVLARPAADLASTDVPDEVLDRLRTSRVRDVHVIVRGQPHQARFSHLELLTLGELADVRVLVHARHGVQVPGDLPAERAEAERITRNIALLRSWHQPAGESPPSRTAPRRIHLHFGERIAAISCADGRYRMSLAAADEDAQAARPDLVADMVITAIGYRGRPIPELPFDDRKGLIPNVSGRVVRNGRVVRGAYVTGWIKRGPSGVIAASKSDAAETVSAVLADLRISAGPAASTTRETTSAPVPVRRVPFEPPASATDWEGWLNLDAYEVAAGLARGAGRVKVPQLAAMLEVCRGDRAGLQSPASGMTHPCA